MNISLPTGGNLYFGATSQPKPAIPAPAPVEQKPQVAPTNADDARLEEVTKAAQVVQSNYFIVSDVRFTIFKDIAGDYVTRFTSLKDGSVKYFPQKSLFEEMKVRRAQEAAIFKTEA